MSQKIGCSRGNTGAANLRMYDPVLVASEALIAAAVRSTCLRSSGAAVWGSIVPQ